MTPIQRLTTERIALKLEMEAAEKLLEAAHLKQSGMDIMHLEQHMQNLLRRWQRCTAQLFEQIRKAMV